LKATEDIVAVILAAGESKRMGTPKQLLPWQNTTMLGHTLKVAKSVFDDEVFVVLGANYDSIRISEGVNDSNLIFNPNYKKGQGSSLSAGMACIARQKKSYGGVLLMLCDQPLITVDYIIQLKKTFLKSNKGIVATKYEKNAGVPALFNHKYFNEMKNVESDTGAKKIIAENINDTLLLDAQGKELDIDTKDEYEFLRSKLKL